MGLKHPFLKMDFWLKLFYVVSLIMVFSTSGTCLVEFWALFFVIKIDFLEFKNGHSKRFYFENIFWKFWPNKCHRTLGNWIWSKTHQKSSKSDVYSSSYIRIFEQGRNWVKQTHWGIGMKKNNMSFCYWAKTTCCLQGLRRAPKVGKWDVVFTLTGKNDMSFFKAGK